jgi:hypothetical protein
MRIEDMGWWDYDSPLFEGCFIECPKCFVATSHEEWEESCILCDDCGEHAALVCPNCNSVIDLFLSPRLHILKDK